MFSFILSFLAPAAHAAGIDTLGAGAEGIDEMWSMIKSALPFSSIGAGGVTFVTLKATAIILSTLSAIAVLSIVYGGIKMITTGTEEGFTEAKKLITFTAVGLVLAMLADGIVLYVIAVLNKALA